MAIVMTISINVKPGERAALILATASDARGVRACVVSL